MNKLRYNKGLLLKQLLLALGIMAFVGCAFADTGSTPTLGSIASNITGSFSALGKLMFAVSFIAGFGFVIAGVFKFKQHKDNPTQIPMGTPIAMVLIGVVLIFLPSLLKPVGKTMFPNKATYGGFTGSGITSTFNTQQ